MLFRSRLGSADYTATNGTTVVLASAASSGDLVTVESFLVSSVLNAIPATAGSVSASYLASGAARSNWGAGGVLQVVNATYSTQVTTTSASFVTTGLTASITPSSSTNKILVIATMPFAINTANENTQLTIYRGGTNISPNTALSALQSGAATYGSACLTILDSPSTTSSTTYTVYGNASGTKKIGRAHV